MKPLAENGDPNDAQANESDLQNVGPEDGEGDRDTIELRRIGAVAKGVFQEVFPGWDSEDRALAQGIEAQVAAGSLGIKPLYFDPWDRGTSAVLAGKFAGKLPPGVAVRSNADGFYIYRPEAVEPILQSDPTFYRPNGEDTWAAIARVSPNENGELLGYGARSMVAGEVTVRIQSPADETQIYAGFRAMKATAAEWARRRASEIARYIGEPVIWVIE